MVWDSVRGEELARVGVEDEGGDLGRSGEGVEAGGGGGVPEMNRSI